MSPGTAAMPSLAVAAAVLLLLLLLPVGFSDVSPSSDAASLLLLKASFANADSTPLKSWSPSSASPPCEWEGVVCSRDAAVTILRLAGMNLTGTINVEALSRLKALRSVSLNGNNLSGPLPPLGRLDGLKSIYLSSNKFSGEVPDDSFAEMDHLKKLFLDGNSLSGRIPSSLSKAASLIELRLERNNFTGPIPELDIGSLRSFNVSDNAGLAGPIPAPLARFGPGSFQGAPGLCGAPLSPCGDGGKASDEEGSPPGAQEEEEEGSGSGSGRTVLMVVVAAVIVVLIVALKKNRRHEVVPFDGMGDDTTEAMEAAAAAEPVVDPTRKKKQQQGGGSTTTTGGSAPRGAGGGVPELVMVNEEKGAFGLPDLMKASAEVLGNGALGSVYKAVMANGLAVAVKRMRELNRVGKDLFDAEMRKFGRLKHKNVLTPLAYHYRKEEKLIVSEFVSRGSLLYLLHGDRGAEHAALDWPTRLKIIRGVVRGAAHLHAELSTTDVPHGNLKSSNVLIHHDFEPVVADYGFVGLVNQSQSASALFAYRAPEAVQHRHVCPKSDVYCLGVVILEVMTGKLPLQYLSGGGAGGGTDVVQACASAAAEGREAEVLDQDVVAGGPVGDMVGMLKIGVACVDADLERRPTMKEAARMVEEIPTPPAEPPVAAAGESEAAQTFKEAYRNG